MISTILKKNLFLSVKFIRILVTTVLATETKQPLINCLYTIIYMIFTGEGLQNFHFENAL